MEMDLKGAAGGGQGRGTRRIVRAQEPYQGTSQHHDRDAAPCTNLYRGLEGFTLHGNPSIHTTYCT